MTVVRRDDPYEVELSGVEVGLLWMAIFSQAQKRKDSGYSRSYGDGDFP